MRWKRWIRGVHERTCSRSSRGRSLKRKLGVELDGREGEEMEVVEGEGDSGVVEVVEISILV